MFDRIVHPAVRIMLTKLSSCDWNEVNKNGEFYDMYADLFRTSNIIEQFLLARARAKSIANDRKAYKKLRREAALSRVVKAAVNDTWDEPDPARRRSFLSNIRLTTTTPLSEEALEEAFFKKQMEEEDQT